MERPKKFTVIGNPVKHSLSPKIHSLFAKQFKLDLQYDTTLAPLEDFNGSVKSLIAEGYNGANVSLPFKQQAFDLANDLSPRAKASHTVNTLMFNDNGIIFGDNTDGVGLVEDLTNRLKIELSTKNILILGAGGASRGIIAELLQQKPERVSVVNRGENNLALLKQQYPDPKVQTYRCDNFKPENYDLIINALAIDCKDFTDFQVTACIAQNSFCYDLNYDLNQSTAFLNYVKNNGCNHLSDGLGMLIAQAAVSFELWTGLEPDKEKVLKEVSPLL